MKPAKILGIAAAGCLVILCVGALVLVLTVRKCVHEPEDVAVSAQAPLDATLGARFDIVATVTNHASKPRTLVDVDIDDDYLKGVAVEGSEPPYKSTMQIPISGAISHHFDLTIPAKGSIQIRFKSYAAYAGDYSGDIDFCIDRETSCTTYRVRTIIKP